MNYSIIRYILGWVLTLESIFMLLPCVVAVIYQESAGYSFLIVALICFVLGTLIIRKKPKNQVYFAREGFVTVALSWIVMSFFGALPFVINGDIPNVINALFEVISGFTTTGASILTDVEALNRCSLFWRSFTHWIGGMGVFVFLLAILPMAGGYNMHLMRAESPGPSVGKLVPRVKDTAKILYLIYIVMTVIEIILLLAAGMPVFDSFTTAFGTAGTGGFGVKNSSMADYSAQIQWIVTIFMILFGVNFNAYYILLGRHKGNVFKMEELRWYFGIIAVSIGIITFNISGMFENIFTSLRHSAFQVASIITTTGFATTDFDQWPQLSKTLLVILMFIGACAGSTGGGIKVSRIVILFKTVKQEMGYFVHPRSVKVIKMDDKALDKDTVRSVSAFLVTYVIIFGVSMTILAFDNLDMTSNFTAIAATFNNIGPGLELVGPTGNFSMFSPLAKCVLMFDMLAGRLELYPVLLLFTPSVWKRK
ncbi:TrkH family potassium uptake protein [Hespellia stercorisuis]|uniref:Trk system potassium uptake protein TrkH n=1 Tax=Hespellia stercorisuis DSM 15480 TaxID=1121950 RepID=A0A1M6PGU6_9FIRM|nr:TrkH family potassium uptake protein [Hespellia stercorisuis]SHK07175.1 trk system potassium uptake protein TrkH [Hespellia stercorisuis DSM 15480]